MAADLEDFKNTNGIIQREKLIRLCADLKSRTDWNKLTSVINGNTNYYENWFQGEISDAKKIILKLRTLVIEETITWTREQRQAWASRPEGIPVLKDWFMEGKIQSKKLKL